MSAHVLRQIYTYASTFHRPTFVFRDYIRPLLLKAIAIGSLYLGPKDAVSRGEALWEIAYTAITTS
jgi:hypothetical protein